MIGIDELIVALWFLPVVLFIVMPLALTCLWLAISPVIVLFRAATGQSKGQQTLKSTAAA